MIIPRDSSFSMYNHKVTKSNVGYLNLTLKIIRCVYICNFLHLYVYMQSVQNDFGVIGDEIICDFGMKFSQKFRGLSRQKVLDF